jgi:hypothetical protein
MTMLLRRISAAALLLLGASAGTGPTTLRWRVGVNKNA